MAIMIDEISDHRAQYEANMRRLATLDRLLAALHAHQAHPCNIHWREVLAALAKVPNPPLEFPNANTSRIDKSL